MRPLDQDSIDQMVGRIKIAMKEAGGNRTMAANILGIGRATLYKYMKFDDELSEMIGQGYTALTRKEIQQRAEEINNGLHHNLRKFKNDGDGYLYLIREKWRGLVKIGVSKDVKARLSAIRSNCPQEVELLSAYLVDSPYQIESMLHEEYKDHCYQGEWYELTQEQVEEILLYLGEVHKWQLDWS